MLITIIILLAGIAGGFVNYYAAKGELFNKNGKPKKNGWTFLACISAVVLLAVAQKFGQDYFDNKHEAALQARYDSSLSANTLKIKSSFDSGNIKLVVTLSKTIGEYKLKYDSVNNKIAELIRDSSKTRIVEAETPVFQLDIDANAKGIEFTKKEYPDYSISETYISADAGSAGFKIKKYLVLADSSFNNLQLVKEDKLLDSVLVLSKDATVTKTTDFSTAKPFAILLLWLKGTYTNRDGNKILSPNNFLYYLRINSNDVGLLQGALRKRIIDFIRSQQKNKD
jgi:hypothetical protein